MTRGNMNATTIGRDPGLIHAGVLGNEAAAQASREQVDRVAEGVVASSLFARHADTVVTIRGVTGTLSALGSLCPKDLTQEAPEAIHEWTVGVLTESGYELTDEDKTFIPLAAEPEDIPSAQKKN